MKFGNPTACQLVNVIIASIVQHQVTGPGTDTELCGARRVGHQTS